MSPTSPRRDDRDERASGSDPLREAMDRVRGRQPASRPVEATPDASTPAGLTQPRARRRRIWDVRGRVADDLARVPTPGTTTWPGQAAGLVAGAWAAAMSFLLFAGIELIGWVFAPLGSGGFGDVMRAAGASWLLADGGVVHWQQAVISLPPLLATLVILLFQRRAAGWLVGAVDARDPRSAVAPLVFAVLASASMQALLAASISNDALTVPMWRSLLGAAIVATVGFGWGISRSIGITPSPRWDIPLATARRFLVLVMLSAAALVLALGVLQRSAFSGVLGAVAGDATSVLQVLALCLLYLPTLVLWAVATLLGPGFGLGTGTSVTLQGTTLGALPPIPLLALIPESTSRALPVLLAVPLVAALWSTRAVSRSTREALLAAAGSSLLAAALALVAAGGMGPGRLRMVGPVWWQVGLASGLWVLAACGLWAGSRWLRLRLQDAGGSAEGAAGKLGP